MIMNHPAVSTAAPGLRPAAITAPVRVAMTLQSNVFANTLFLEYSMDL